MKVFLKRSFKSFIKFIISKGEFNHFLLMILILLFPFLIYYFTILIFYFLKTFIEFFSKNYIFLEIWYVLFKNNDSVKIGVIDEKTFSHRIVKYLRTFFRLFIAYNEFSIMRPKWYYMESLILLISILILMFVFFLYFYVKYVTTKFDNIKERESLFFSEEEYIDSLDYETDEFNFLEDMFFEDVFNTRSYFPDEHDRRGRIKPDSDPAKIDILSNDYNYFSNVLFSLKNKKYNQLNFQFKYVLTSKDDSLLIDNLDVDDYFFYDLLQDELDTEFSLLKNSFQFDSFSNIDFIHFLRYSIFYTFLRQLGIFFSIFLDFIVLKIDLKNLLYTLFFNISFFFIGIFILCKKINWFPIKFVSTYLIVSFLFFLCWLLLISII